MKKHIKSLLYLLFISLLFEACNQNAQEKRAEEIKAIMETQMASLRSKEFFKDNAIREYLKDEFEKFYTDRNYQMAWLTSDKLLPQADSLLNAIHKAGEEGLVAENYNLEQIQALGQEVFNKKKNKKDSLALQQLVKLDFLMTSAYMTYGAHLLAGRIDPQKLHEEWITHPRKKNLAEHLEQALKNKHIYRSLYELSPVIDQYGKLRQQLALYRNIHQAGGWPQIPADLAASKKQALSPEVISLLRKRLSLTGDIDSTQTAAANTAASGNAFDSEIAAGLKKFQARHGLDADGKLTKETVAWLNEPLEKKIEQIELNMERIRWLPDSIGKTYLLVNVPEYKLKVFKNGNKQMEMNVIVGKEYASTPIFTDTLEHIVFSPDWTVPLSIAQEEILPILQKNPDYLANNEMVMYASWDLKDSTEVDPYSVDWATITPESFNYRIVQIPGPRNPLGSIKFMLPNDLHIYLHDTPGGHLFNRKDRGFSHGCVRVEKPADLAVYLLKGEPGWTHEKVQEYMNKEEPVTVDLPQHLPVQIVYRTAWVDEQGILNFRNDIYGHDEKQIKAILRKENQLQSMANIDNK